MTIKAWGSGPLSMSEIQTEYGGSNPISFSEYYNYGTYLYPNTIGFPNNIETLIPQSGPISIANFYGSYKLRQFLLSQLGYGVNSILIPPGTWKIMIRLVGGGGGGGGWDEGGSNPGAPGGYGVSLLQGFMTNSSTQSRIRIYVGGGGGGGANGVTNPVMSNGGISAATGYFSGAYDSILRGGHGGSSGNSGTSGCGGGGGGATAVGWLHNTALGDNNEVLIALAGGGGGGTGSGQYSLIPAGAIGNANLRDRGMTYSTSTLITLDADIDRYTSGGTAYRLAGKNSDGQGWRTMRNYYPPGATDALIGAYDGGGGGGGGGGNGLGGGLTKSANNNYIWRFEPYCDKNGCGAPFWAPPIDFCGDGGTAGYAFVSTANTNIYSSTYGGRSYSGTYNVGYGLGGAANNGSGTAGCCLVKITNNLSDNVFPS